MEKQIYIIRHGETEYNRKGIVQGSGIDSDLNDLGRSQAWAFYEHYQDHPFEVVLTSRLKRTHQTVEPFLRLGLPWEQFEEINEISWGELDGSPSSPEMHAIYRKVVGEWRKGNLAARHGDGESAEEMGARLHRFVTHLRQRREERVLICSHGRAIRAMICLLLEKPLSQMDAFGHENTGLYQLNFSDGAFHLQLANDTRHLHTVER
ncbi:MAG: histidine phosphatase family protein [Saprospirales bacterium]|nr:histidine phosphatase family protein [Saprospirales bacterium]